MGSSRSRYVTLNRNILAAFIASIVISAVAAQMLAGEQDHLNATYTLIVDYSVYFGVFGVLYYFDNRRRYSNWRGVEGRGIFWTDMAKIVSSLGIAELVYTVIRWVVQYQLLTVNYDPYIASVASQAVSFAVYALVLNLNVKVSRLYRDGT